MLSRSCLALLLAAVASSCQQPSSAAKQSKPQALTGIYAGLDELKGFPAEQAGDKWYHENIVYIRLDSLFLEGNPVVVHRNGKKSYSASDGGFYSFSGRIDTTTGQLTARLRMFAHDYISPAITIRDKDTATVRKLGLAEALRRGLVVEDSSFFKRTYTIRPTPKGFKMDSISYMPFQPDSTLGLPGFPDAKRFFKKK